MNRRRFFFGGTVLACLFGITVAGWIASHPIRDARPSAEASVTDEAKWDLTTPLDRNVGPTGTSPAGDTESFAGATDEPAVESPWVEVETGKLTWETQIDGILGSSASDAEKATLLLGQLSKLPAEAYGRIAEEAIERLPDKEYDAAALPILLRPDTHGAIAAVLYADLLERPDLVALPALLALAQVPHHPYSGQAREALALLAGQDCGEDWQRWRITVAGLLAQKR